MYARPPLAVPAASPARRGFNGPLAAICCLALILFLIAATIVIALIPVYLSTKDVETGNTQDYYFAATPDRSTGLGDDGNLDAAGQSALAAAISKEQNFDSDALEFDGNVAVGPLATRRKRDLMSRDKRAGDFPRQTCRGKGHFKRRGCRGACRLRSLDFYITITITYGGITYNNLRFHVIIYLVAIDFPALRPSTTIAATAVTTAAVTTVATTTNAIG